MKTLKELEGVKKLTKNDQRFIKGGFPACGDGYDCNLPGWCCPVDYHLPGNFTCEHHACL